jgi:hypothetical protein
VSALARLADRAPRGGPIAAYQRARLLVVRAAAGSGRPSVRGRSSHASQITGSKRARAPRRRQSGRRSRPADACAARRVERPAAQPSAARLSSWLSPSQITCLV